MNYLRGFISSLNNSTLPQNFGSYAQKVAPFAATLALGVTLGALAFRISKHMPKLQQSLQGKLLIGTVAASSFALAGFTTLYLGSTVAYLAVISEIFTFCILKLKNEKIPQFDDPGLRSIKNLIKLVNQKYPSTPPIPERANTDGKDSSTPPPTPERANVDNSEVPVVPQGTSSPEEPPAASAAAEPIIVVPSTAKPEVAPGAATIDPYKELEKANIMALRRLQNAYHEDATPHELIGTSIELLLNFSNDKNIQADYLMRFKGKLENVYLTHNSKFAKDEKRLRNQLAVLVDVAYLGMQDLKLRMKKKDPTLNAKREQARNKAKIDRIVEFLKNPVEWTKVNGEGPGVYKTGEEKFEDIAWRGIAKNLDPRSNDLCNLAQVCMLPFQDILGTLDLEKIKANDLFDLPNKGEMDFTDWAFYDRDAYILFERTELRAEYSGQIIFERTVDVVKKPISPWKFCIFVQKEDLPKAWDVLRPILFAKDSPLESGKIARLKTENETPQIVLYTYPEKMGDWEATLRKMEEALRANGIRPLEAERKSIIFTTPDKYQLMTGSDYIHYTLERYKILAPDRPVEGNPVPNLPYLRLDDSGFYQIQMADYLKLSPREKVNPGNIPNPFESIDLSQA